MDLETFRTHCLSLNGVTEEFPFGEDVLVYKVGGKMFALAGMVPFERVSLKVDPEVGVELRERYEAVQPAYHMNKKHWVMVQMDGTVPDKLVKEWIGRSYELVMKALPARMRAKRGY